MLTQSGSVYFAVSVKDACWQCNKGDRTEYCLCSSRCVCEWVLWRLQLLCSCEPGLRIRYCQCQCVGYVSYFRLLDLRAEASRVIRHVKPPPIYTSITEAPFVSVSSLLLFTNRIYIDTPYVALMILDRCIRYTFNCWKTKFDRQRLRHPNSPLTLPRVFEIEVPLF